VIFCDEFVDLFVFVENAVVGKEDEQAKFDIFLVHS